MRCSQSIENAVKSKPQTFSCKKACAPPATVVHSAINPGSLTIANSTKRVESEIEQSATRRRIASSIAINATPSIVIVVVIAIVIIIVIVIVIVVEVIMTAMVSMKGNVVGNVIEDALHCALDVVGLMLNPFHTLRVGVLPFLHFLIQKALGERVSVAAGCSLVMGIAAAVYIAIPIDDVLIS